MIECRDVTRIYSSDGVKCRALSNFSVKIDKGEFCIIKGPSGSGKSTLLNIIGCIDYPTSGEYHFKGINPSETGDRYLSNMRARHIGFIFQSFNLIEVLSAYENIRYPLRINKVIENHRDIIKSVMIKIGIWKFRDKKPNQLSGGQRQRVAIARAVIMKPDLILADEPTANLDSGTSENIMELLLELNEVNNTSFLIATHDPFISRYSHRLIELLDGKKVKEPYNDEE